MKKDSTVTEAGLSSIRNTEVSGASTACATSVLIGVTWLTTTTVRPAWSSRRRCNPDSTRSSTDRNDSPVPPGALSSDPSQASRSAWCFSATSANVSPSQAPNSISAKPGSSSSR